MSAAPKRVTQSEFARLRGISRQAVHSLVKRGRIPCEENGLIDVQAAQLALAVRHRGGRPRKRPKETC